jgi:hypothetical protein
MRYLVPAAVGPELAGEHHHYVDTTARVFLTDHSDQAPIWREPGVGMQACSAFLKNRH